MHVHHPIRTSLASAVALAILGAAPVAGAQTPPPPPPPSEMPAPPPPPPAPTAAAGSFYQGTETTATYPLPDSHGGTLTVHAGMPNEVAQYGPPPPFKTLDTDHNGRISESEAQAYPPLDSDFLFASGGAQSVSEAQYKKWVANQH